VKRLDVRDFDRDGVGSHCDGVYVTSSE
jgi:hypothetical protein